MNISNSQVNRLRHFVRAGLRSLFRPEPQTAVEWADANYYLPKESAYQEGRWETLPFQRAIMNAMGSDYIREVNVVKSARVGYSKMLLGVYAYFIEHKQRNTLIWLPTDGDAENFMKTHVEPTIRDIPSLLALAPWYGKKHRDNTLTMKRFTNGRGFWCLGGKAAKNYREKSVDVAGYDELAAFDDDIEQEGSPTFLGDKRIEGSVWPKSIRGSTPKVRGTCQIERAASESPHFMRFHVACPHCGEEQYLKFGDKETPFGLKWTPDDPSSVFYLCEHNACVIRQQELDFTDARYICEKTGIWTRDGILWFSSSGEEIEPPDSVTFHIWTAYSPFTTWVQIVKDWMKTKGDTGKRKTFVNTTLGETWEAKIGERPDAEVMAERKEHYSAPVPDRVAYLTAGIDSQLDRYEMRVWGWGPGEESWLIDRQIIMGRHDDEQTLLRVDEAINKTYTRRNGAEMSISRICWDTGGIDPTIVYERSKKHGLFRVIPIISGNVNANSGTLNNVTINENCRVLGKLSANQIEGDLVKTVGKAFPRDSRAPERWPSGTITVRVYDDQPFDRQIVIPAVAFSGAKHERENNDIYSSCRLIVRKNGAEIYNRTALDNTLIYSGVIDMPAGHGHMTLEFSVSAWLVNDWYPTASISDLLVVVMKKSTAGITIS
ncbi:terminase gpA endonuclease subunit [Escherichia coli]|uniref:terminase gpA endonuclease subunit n=1 Tax=Escherichia coli TaxID=562 RepID=UPI0032D8E2A4